MHESEQKFKKKEKKKRSRIKSQPLEFWTQAIKFNGEMSRYTPDIQTLVYVK